MAFEKQETAGSARSEKANLRLIFWQNMPSPHQSPYIRALAEHPNMEVNLVVQDPLPAWRRNIGWSEPDFGRTKVYVQPGKETILQLISHSLPDDVHLFTGIRAYPMVWQAFRAAIDTPARIGLISEPGYWLGVFGLARLLRARVEAARYGRRLNFILAIGHLAMRWFAMAGYAGSKTYRFAYCTEKPTLLSSQPFGGQLSTDRPVKLAFIGQCIRRKGADLLLEALGGLRDPGWELDIVGDGEERPALEQLSSRLGLQDRVHFWGSKTNSEAMRILETSDVLVLPSRWDGWGAVVNEALIRGVPVICSDRCGAADLLGQPERGTVFKAGSVAKLRSALVVRTSVGKRTAETSRRIEDWARVIAGESVADYVLEVLDASTGEQSSPVPPWFSQRDGDDRTESVS